ncbi:uncharacterized protein LOC130751463 [Actinidia eriantha]|uniref:uncharacterized protein LOC130751463 n=1 Tax=Actinidia eriantha TaxID=165200 RepID=UPI002587A833|nr:uncharacterized protein LOC130751463 [Actinidia eriantha]
MPKLRNSEDQDFKRLTFPITNFNQTKLFTPLKGFIRPLQGSEMEHGNMPSQRTKEGFDLIAYKLLAKAGYSPQESTTLGKLSSEAIGENMHGLNSTQNILKQKGYAVQNSHIGLGYTPPAPVRIVIKKSSSYHITAEENASPTPTKPSVFDRLGKPKSRTSIFDRLGPSSTVPTLPIPRRSVHERLGVSSLSKPKEAKKRKNVISFLEDDEKLRSAIPSRMKRYTTIVVTINEVLKMRLKTVIVTKTLPEASDVSAFEESAAYSYHITTLDGEDYPEEDAEDAPLAFEEGVKSIVDDLNEINLGTLDDPRPVYISALLTSEEQKMYIELLSECKDVFAWSYKEMPGLDPKVAVHNLAVKRGVRPIKQAQRRFRPELIPKIETEVNKLIEADFIREVKYPTWISSIVPVKKKNGQIRICVDFRDLNNACPKDDFPLPITELMIDATTGHEALSFMDDSSSYNQIRMAPRDEELTAFRTPKGIYCYKVMPFGLKNAGATYQRAMQKIFDDMFHKNIECYVDDLVVKTRDRNNHLEDLKKVFDRLRRYQLKMNPLKCAFGVTFGKFLGFIVRRRGIEIEQSKIEAILKMPEPRNIHELKSLQGRLAYLRRFISNLAGRCQPFSRLMKKGIPFEWDETCNNAFKSIKAYLIKPPVLVAPIPGRPLVLYIAAQERSVGALLAQENDEGKENALYYLSRMMTHCELNYSPIEKMCLALVFVVQKLRHYFQAHTVHLVSKANSVKYIMTKPVLSDRLARWSLLLQEFEIIYVSQKAIKGQALADFLADHPIPADWELSEELPDEDVLFIQVQLPWKMYFDGASHREGAGTGVVFLTPEGDVLPYAFTLTQLCSNNEAEYQALILRLEMAVDMKQLRLEVYGDSKLIINQLLNIYEVKKPEIVPYYNYATRMIGWLGGVTLEHVSRTKNRQADALAKLASSLALPDVEARISIYQRWVIPPHFDDEYNNKIKVNAISVFEIEKEDWRQSLIDYLQHGKLPENPHRRTDIRRRAPRFIYYNSTLYRRSFEELLLRCLGENEATHALEEAHSGICGAHQSGPKFHF